MPKKGKCNKLEQEEEGYCLNPKNHFKKFIFQYIDKQVFMDLLLLCC